MRADGHAVSTSTVQRALRRRGLLLPAGYRADRKSWAVLRRRVFLDPPTERNRRGRPTSTHPRLPRDTRPPPVTTVICLGRRVVSVLRMRSSGLLSCPKPLPIRVGAEP